ncbi:MAG: hypothetical protein KY453_12575, partial [Gemmatimonadetes bacterium]|nr:hypothetical protein [Gemmatimonadota bacterium]
HDVLVGGAAAEGRVPMSLALFAPHRLEAGVSVLPTWPVRLLNERADALPASVAAVALVSHPVAGSVDEVIATEAPATVEIRYPGGGEIVVRLVAEGAGYGVAVDVGGVAFTPNGRRYGVVADARLSHTDLALGSSDGVLEIGDTEQAWTRGAAVWDGLPASRSTLRVEAELERDLRVELAWSPKDGATTGTWSVGREAGDSVAGATLRYGDGGTELLAAAVSGTLEVDRFVIAAEGVPGEVAGRVEGTFVGIPGGADTLRAAFDFVAPVDGTGGGQAPAWLRFPGVRWPG